VLIDHHSRSSNGNQQVKAEYSLFEEEEEEDETLKRTKDIDR
jgi:hypothetical protein